MLDYSFIKLAQTADSFKAQKKTNTFQVQFAKEAGAIETLEGLVHYNKDDALITGLEAETWPASRAYFDMSYTPIPPTNMGEDGQYQTNPVEVLVLPIDQNCQVSTHSGDTLTGNKGDYLIQYPTGDYGIIAQHIFERLYEN